MKASRKYFMGAAVLAGGAIFVTGCGDDVTEVTKTEIDAVATIKDAKCTEDGAFIFAKDDNTTYICDDGKWTSAMAETSSISCEMKTIKNSDGYKLVCNGDSLGVFFNGVKGEVGKQGKSGEDGDPGKNGADAKNAEPGNPGKDGQDGVPCSIKELTEDSLQVLCGEEVVSVPRPVPYTREEFRLQASFDEVYRWVDLRFNPLNGKTLILEALDEETLQKTGDRYISNDFEIHSLKFEKDGKITDLSFNDSEYVAQILSTSYDEKFEKNGNHLAEVSMTIAGFPLFKALENESIPVLKTVVNLDDSAAFKISLISTYTFGRVKALLKEGKSVKEAKQQAAKEFYKFWGIDQDSKGMDSLFKGAFDGADMLEIALVGLFTDRGSFINCFMDSSDFEACNEDEVVNMEKEQLVNDLANMSDEFVKKSPWAMPAVAKIIEGLAGADHCSGEVIGKTYPLNDDKELKCLEENHWILQYLN